MKKEADYGDRLAERAQAIRDGWEFHPEMAAAIAGGDLLGRNMFGIPLVGLLSAYGAPKGHKAEGLGRGAIEGAGTATGMSLGSQLGGYLGSQIGGWPLLVGHYGGMLGGGMLGLAGANKLLGDPSWEEAKKNEGPLASKVATHQFPRIGSGVGTGLGQQGSNATAPLPKPPAPMGNPMAVTPPAMTPATPGGVQSAVQGSPGQAMAPQPQMKWSDNPFWRNAGMGAGMMPKMGEFTPFQRAFLKRAAALDLSDADFQAVIKYASEIHPAAKEELAVFTKEALPWGQMGRGLMSFLGHAGQGAKALAKPAIGAGMGAGVGVETDVTGTGNPWLNAGAGAAGGAGLGAAAMAPNVAGKFISRAAVPAASGSTGGYFMGDIVGNRMGMSPEETAALRTQYARAGGAGGALAGAASPGILGKGINAGGMALGSGAATAHLMQPPNADPAAQAAARQQAQQPPNADPQAMAKAQQQVQQPLPGAAGGAGAAPAGAAGPAAGGAAPPPAAAQTPLHHQFVDQLGFLPDSIKNYLRGLEPWQFWTALAGLGITGVSALGGNGWGAGAGLGMAALPLLWPHIQKGWGQMQAAGAQNQVQRTGDQLGQNLAPVARAGQALGQSADVIGRTAGAALKPVAAPFFNPPANNPLRDALGRMLFAPDGTLKRF